MNRATSFTIHSVYHTHFHTKLLLLRACVAMHNGRMFLCASDVVPASTEGCEGTFLITELGSATCIHSVTR